jgi:hypothetical protein
MQVLELVWWKKEAGEIRFSFFGLLCGFHFSAVRAVFRVMAHA